MNLYLYSYQIWFEFPTNPFLIFTKSQPYMKAMTSLLACFVLIFRFEELWILPTSGLDYGLVFHSQLSKDYKAYLPHYTLFHKAYNQWYINAPLLCAPVLIPEAAQIMLHMYYTTSLLDYTRCVPQLQKLLNPNDTTVFLVESCCIPVFSFVAVFRLHILPLNAFTKLFLGEYIQRRIKTALRFLVFLMFRLTMYEAIYAYPIPLH